MKKETKRIISNVAWMTFDKVFMLVLNLLVTVKIANHFGSLGYGTYQYAVNVVAIFEMLVTFVDGRVVKKGYINNNADEVVTTATISRAMFSLLSFLIGATYILSTEQDSDFTIMFVILLLNAIVGNLKFGLANRFEYILQSKKIVIASDSAALLGSGLQLLAVKYHWSIVAISVIALVSSLFNLAILAIQYAVQFKSLFRGKVNKKLLLSMVKESTPLAIAASCATIYTRCDSVMLGNMMTASEVGIYSIAAKLISIVQIAIIPIRETVYPKLIQLYSSSRSEYEKQYIKISSLLTWIYLVGVTVSFGILPIAFQFLNAEYAAALPVYKIYVLGSLFMYNAALRAGHFTLIGRGSILTYSQLISVVLNIFFNYFGIKYFGMYGAAMATVVTQCLSLMLSNLMFKKDGYEVFMWQLKAFNPVHIFR